jgi:DNA invertase Pin-like site-specific DNA recombinase
MRMGYARVSNRDQNLELQLDALDKAGCKRIFTDKLSGAQVERPGLKEALSHLRETDTLVVWKLDRLGRIGPRPSRTRCGRISLGKI